MIVDLWRAGLDAATPVVQHPGHPVLYFVHVSSDDVWLVGPICHMGGAVVIAFGSLQIALQAARENGAVVPLA